MDRNIVIALRGEGGGGIARVAQSGTDTKASFSLRSGGASTLSAYLIVGARAVELPLGRDLSGILPQKMDVDGVILCKQERGSLKFLYEGRVQSKKPDFEKIKEALRLRYLAEQAGNAARAEAPPPKAQKEEADTAPVKTEAAPPVKSAAQVKADTAPPVKSAGQVKAGITPQNKPAPQGKIEPASEIKKDKPAQDAPNGQRPDKGNIKTQEPVQRWAKEEDPAVQPEVYGQEDNVIKQRQMRTLRTMVPSDAPVVDGRERDPLPGFVPETLLQNEQSLRGTNAAAPKENDAGKPPVAPDNNTKGKGSVSPDDESKGKNPVSPDDDNKGKTPVSPDEDNKKEKSVAPDEDNKGGGNPAKKGEQKSKQRADAPASKRAAQEQSFRESEPITNPFPEAYPNSTWIKVRYPGTDRYYLEGSVENQNGRFTIHALPGEYAPVPPNKNKGFTRFLRAADGSGYWLKIRKKQG